MNSPPRGPFPFRIPWSSFQKLEAIRKNHDCFSLPDHLNYIIIQPTNLTPKHVSKNHGHQMNPTGLSWFVKLDSPIHNFILRVMQSVKVAIACVFFKQTKPHTKKKTGQSWWCLRAPAVESCYKTQYFQNIAVQRNMAVGVVPIETGRLLDVEVSPQVTHKFHYLSTWVPFTVRPCEADIFDIWSSSLSDTDENTQRHNCNTKLFLFTE